MNNKTWLIGSGGFAQKYIPVLKTLETEIVVVGRGKTSSREFQQQTGVNVISGGIEAFLETKPEAVSHAIVCVSRETLSDVTCQLLKYGIKNILVEKPAGLTLQEIQNIQKLSEGSNVVVAFNRRHYSSVIKLKELIQAEGGVKSFHFEFTEWSHKIKDLVQVKGQQVMNTWFLGNSIHVVDLAFYLGGAPKEISTYTSGHLDWHPSASVFSGAGVTEAGALYSYHANWESAGRWSVEIMTNQNRYYLRPLEELYVQKRGQLNLEKVNVDNELDVQFNPGLYLQLKKFYKNEIQDFCWIEDYAMVFPKYLGMAGY